MTSPTLSAGTHVGGVTLQVSDLTRSIAFYRDLLGFVERSSTADTVELGAPGGTRAVVTLHERRGAKPLPPHRRLGLFHFAILLPSRGDLAGVLVHLHQHGVPMGMSDHLVSEALYLNDPDGLGIEIYSDRPRATWMKRGDELAMATEPLDVEGLVSDPTAHPWTGMPAGTTIGHVHLHVGDLAGAERFYGATLGLDVVVRSYPGALFLSAGGYHHHLGTNTWARGATPPAADEAQLLGWDLVVEDAAEVQAVRARVTGAGGATTSDAPNGFTTRDPFGTPVRIVAA